MFQLTVFYIFHVIDNISLRCCVLIPNLNSHCEHLFSVFIKRLYQTFETGDTCDIVRNIYYRHKVKHILKF